MKGGLAFAVLFFALSVCASSATCPFEFGGITRSSSDGVSKKFGISAGVAAVLIAARALWANAPMLDEP